MPSTSPAGGPGPALSAMVALALVLASVGAVAGGGPASGADPAAVSTETHTVTPVTETHTATPVTESGGVNLTLLAGPESVFEDLDDYGTFRAASDGSALERTGRVRRGETLVIAFRSPRLNRSYAAAEATGTTPRFFEAVNRTNATVSVTAPAEPSCQPLRIRLQESRVRALVERDGPGFAVALKTGAVSTEGGCGSGLQTPGEYRATVEVPTADGSRRSAAVFELSDGPRRGPEEARVHRGAPSLASTLDTAVAVRAATRNGTLVPSTHVVRGGVAVLSFRSERLNRTYANTSGPNATARLSTAVEATGGTLSLSTSRESTDDDRVVLPGPGVRTLHDARNATFHLVIDTERARVRQVNGTLPLTMASEREVEFDLRVPTEGGDTQRREARLFLSEPSGRLRVGRNRSALPSRAQGVAVVGTDGQFVVTPETNLAPGWNLTVRAVAPNGTTLATREGSSGGDDTDSARPKSTRGDERAYEFDLGPLSEDDRFHLTLHAANATLGRSPVAVGVRPTLRNATARRVGAGPGGSAVRFAVTAHYPGPGYVVVRTQDGYAGFEVPGDEPTRVQGTVQLPSADHRDEFSLIAVYDSNGNGTFDGPDGAEEIDQPFRSGDRGLLRTNAPLPPPTPTPTVTAPPPGTTIPVSGTDGQPGFGILAAVLGVLALVGLAVGRRRSRDHR